MMPQQALAEVVTDESTEVIEGVDEAVPDAVEPTDDDDVSSENLETSSEVLEADQTSRAGESPSTPSADAGQNASAPLDRSGIAEVSSAAELEDALLSGASSIRLAAGFSLDRTFYITGATTIFADSRITLARDPQFPGDVFVVGTDASGSVYPSAALTLGRSGSTERDVLVLDGNAESMLVDVVGSMVYVTAGATAGLFEDVDIANCAKVGNQRSSAIGAAGAAVLVEDGTLNAEGASFQLNVATKGGAIYNAGMVVLQGCSFTQNVAVEEGGALYGAADAAATVTGCEFQSNLTQSADDGNGGAIAVHSNSLSIDGCTFSGNSSARHGGALYVSYASDSPTNSVVSMENTSFAGNRSEYHGGAVYVTAKDVAEPATVLTASDVDFNENSASYNGGGLYLTSSSASLEDVTFEGNSAEAAANSSGTRYGGGALYATGSQVDIVGVTFLGNHSEFNGGAVSLYSSSAATMSSVTFDGNDANNFGGAIFVTGACTLSLTEAIASSNSAGNGGFMYETTTATTVTINSITVSGNTATTAGPLVYGNTTKAILNVNKAHWTDLETENLDGAYWKAAFANKLTVNEIADPDPGIDDPEEPGDLTDHVTTAAELQAAASAGMSPIYLASDIMLDRTIYLDKSVDLVAEEARTLTRSASFLGDLFVVGEDAEGNPAGKITVNIAKNGAGTITIDGNGANVSGTVTGSCFFIAGNSTVNLYPSLTVTNCNKTGNVRAISESYGITSSSHAGGSVAIVAGGTLNVRGGSYVGNASSDWGGAIFNAAKLSVTGGAFEGNSAARGGAIANVNGTADIRNVSFRGNTASEEGGAIYNGADVALTLVGAEFEQNTAGTHGGALSLHSNSMTVNGGSFQGNAATSNGGALYVSYASSSASNSCVTLEDVVVSGNTSGNYGGAVYVTAQAVDDPRTVLSASEVVFRENEATSNGGALYFTGGATGLLEDVELASNTSRNFGGALFATGASDVTVRGGRAIDNQAKNGGLLYETTTGTEVTLDGITVGGNAATATGPMVYGNTYNATLYVNKAAHVDTEVEVYDDAYWAAAVVNKLTVVDISGTGGDDSLPTKADVASADELEAALNAGTASIRVTADFEIDRTFYVTGTTTIYATKAHTLTRAAGFAGDVFVVGESSDGENAIATGKAASLTLGRRGSAVKGLLTIDGNREGTTVPVAGTVLFICYSATVNIYPNASIVNCNKIANSRTNDPAYGLPYTDRIGGAVSIVANGALNIYGGTFSNNSVLPDEATSDRTSSMGGVVFNYSNVNVYGGTFEQNSSGRGAVIYNYRMANIYGGTFTGNYATKYGGVVYQAASQYGELLVGKSSGYQVLFEGNSAGNSGGAIYSQTVNAIVIYGNTTFRGNRAVLNNGGAINNAGTLTIKGATFEGNEANSKGGAIYLVYNDPDLTTRYAKVQDTTFSGNVANRGGAVGMMAGEAEYANGPIATFEGCTFTDNRATVTDATASDRFGGALYAIRKSTLTVRDSMFAGNTADEEGGALYASGESTVRVSGSNFEGNSSTVSGGNGGAVAVHSCVLDVSESTMTSNSCAKNGGALYVSYASSSEVDSTVTLDNVEFTSNTSANHGGAVYVTCHVEEHVTPPLTVLGSTFAQNRASYNGGAAYLTGSSAYMEGPTFTGNVADATANAEGTRYGGGALYCTGSQLELNGATFSQNSSDYNGGAIALYSSSELVGNALSAEGNTAAAYGGALYANGSVMRIYHSRLSGNSAKNGGAIALYTDSATSLYTTELSGNTCTNNGGALYVYTGARETMVRDCVIEGNQAANYGGGAYCSNASQLCLYGDSASQNSAKNGGFLYVTTAGTTVGIAGLEVSGNTASAAGPLVYGNANGAIINIDKSQYRDLDVDSLDDDYWAQALAGKLTVNEVSITMPSYEDYSHDGPGADDPTPKDPVPVEDVFSLEGGEGQEAISATYDALPPLDQSSNFMSQETSTYEGVNGKTVTVDTLVRHPNDAEDNPSFGEGILIYQAMLYKRAHPEEEVNIDVSSFRFSVEAAVCINRNSKYFGYMRNLGKKEYDENGFVRVAYLLVSAAKMGVNVTVIGQMDAYPRSSGAPSFDAYFTARLDEPCDPAYTSGVVGDHLKYRYVYWTAYGDDAATDMMHTKLCAVSHYLDKDGVEHSGSVWMSSTNLDGINSTGTNGNNGVQTGCIISDHDEIYRISRNYLQLISEYCGQEDVYEFREIVIQRMNEQIDLINQGRGGEIPAAEQIVYLGGEDDGVFELYFSPFGGDSATWDEVHNPFCKYMRKLCESDDYIMFSWSNVKFSKNFTLSSSMERMIVKAFHDNRNPENRLYILLPSFDSSAFNDLQVGVDIGYKSIGTAAYGTVHSKDLQFSYSENGQRHYVTLLNSMNVHYGAMAYQSNYALVIHETECPEDSVFFAVADQTTSGMVDHHYGDEQIHDPVGTEEGYRYRACTECGRELRTGIIHNTSGGWIVDREATETEKGLKHRECVACGEVLEVQEIEAIPYQANDDVRTSDVGLSITGDSVLYNLPEVVADVPLTFEAEVYVPKSVRSRAGVIIGNYAGSNVNSVSFEVYTNGHPRIYWRDASRGVSYSYVFDYDIRTGKKEHIAIVLDAGSALLYVNGTLVETKEVTTRMPVLESVLQVGGDARDGNGQYFKGTIYSVNIFADVRTAAEVRRDTAFVAPDADQLVYSKYFTTDVCPAGDDSFEGHQKSGWIVDHEATNETNGCKHTECLACGAILETAEFTIDGSTARTLSLEDAKGLRVTSEETRYALPEVIADVPLTFEAEVYVPKSVSGRAGVIVGNYNGGEVNSVSFEVYSNGNPRLYYRDADNHKSYSYVFSYDIRTGKREHMAITLDGGKASLFINGNRVESIDLKGAPPMLDTPLYVGSDAREGNPQYFKGTIYSVNVFSDVRTDEEMTRDAMLVGSDAENLLYSKYFTGDVCPAGITESTPHVAGDWVVDEEATSTEKGLKHIECTMCGEVLEVSEIPATDYVGSHLDYHSAAGLSINSAADTYIIPDIIEAVPLTVEADILLPKSYSARAGVIVGNYSGSDRQFSFEIYTNGKPRVYIHNGSEYSYVFTTDIRSDSKQHVALTFADGNANLYVNGALKETVAIEPTLPTLSTNLRIGGDARAGNTQYFKGKIYSVHLFDGVRTAEQIVIDRVYVAPQTDGVVFSEYFTEG